MSIQNDCLGLLALPDFAELTGALAAKKSPVCVVGLSGIHRAHLIAALSGADDAPPAIVLTADEASATRLAGDINALLGEAVALFLPARQLTLRPFSSASLEYEHQRLSTLSALAQGLCRIVTASVESASLVTLPPAVLLESTRTLTPGQRLDIRELELLLAKAGYTRVEQVEGVCQFAVRGGIVDIFSPAYPDPVRIEFWGEDIDSISAFKIESQRRELALEEFLITPACEALPIDTGYLCRELTEIAATLRGKRAAAQKESLAADIEALQNGLTLSNLDKYLPLLYEQRATLLDYFVAPRIFLLEPISCRTALKNATWQLHEDITVLLEEGVLCPPLVDGYYDDFDELTRRLLERETLLLDTFPRSMADLPQKALLNVSATQLSSWGGDLSVLLDDLRPLLSTGYRVSLYIKTPKGLDTLLSDLTKEGIVAIKGGEGLSFPEPGQVMLLLGTLSAGFQYPGGKLAVFTHQKQIVTQSRTGKRSKKKGETLRQLSDLTVGDHVVHVSHGIGVFEGIVKREIHGIVKDYIKIRYAGTDTLFVPVNQLDLVNRYIGGGGENGPKLNKLNSVEWQKTRQRVKKAVDEMAEDLIALYSARLHTPGHQFPEDDDMQRDFESRFEFEETDDQLRSIEEIKADMCRESPMDRLLCGDVGFGKTEVALRAAFKCVLDGKQCAILVPTTILAWQHFQTVRRRMEGFPVTIDLLSRFRSPQEQTQVVREMKKGITDIVIGTHRLLQQDIDFKDLGLVIIDEEQRFGVRHKERLKDLRRSVDVLSLSATPIPRTLGMAMSGIRDMSTIEEAPVDRRPVQTYVLEHDWGIIAEALSRELRRDGQAFYLHNRIDSIHSTAAHLKKLLPDARITVAHGRMDEEELSSIWESLVNHQIDILICTTIIETGVDVPNCNTLIIEDADRLGLSQLYQIRGRVGRSSRRAFAYFTFRPGRELTEVATKRLAAIREFTSFGAGFRIAMRDLEIRGAGNILGQSQHGHMESVGYEMYLRLLSDAVAEQQGGAPKQPDTECMIDLQLSAHIPDEYIGSLPQRIDIYKKIAAVISNDDASDLIDELIDRFGEPPHSVLGLIDVSLLRNRAAARNIHEIRQRDGAILLYQTPPDLAATGLLAQKLRGRVLMSGGQSPYIAVRLKQNDDPISLMGQVFDILDQGDTVG